jgi:hypothetical protein
LTTPAISSNAAKATAPFRHSPHEIHLDQHGQTFSSLVCDWAFEIRPFRAHFGNPEFLMYDQFIRRCMASILGDNMPLPSRSLAVSVQML